jgi:biopolymer transport protein ExbB/TolQ
VNQATKLYRAIVLSPLLWGLAVAVVFFYLIAARVPAGLFGQDVQDFLYRYCASHWVLYTEVSAFFVGMAALLVKRLDVAEQLTTLKSQLLGPIPPGGQTAEDCSMLLQQLDRAPASQQDSYLVRRLREAVLHVRRKGYAEELDQELKALADLDDSRANGSYSLVRVIIWAIPILGFLGTVIGITMAIAQLNPKQLEESLNTVIGSLGIAFDTTALALTLSMFLMFTQYAVDKSEQRLLAAVDQRVDDELSQRFLLHKTAGHPDVAVVRRMAETVIEASATLVERQAEVWKSTIAEAHAHWSQSLHSAYGQVEQALSQATSQAMQAHARQITQTSEAMARQNHEHLVQVQQMMAENLQAMREHQQQLIQQGEVLRGVVEATGGVARLEEALNRNLSALAGTHNFEETLESLAAVIHLLNARLTQPIERGRMGTPQANAA